MPFSARIEVLTWLWFVGGCSYIAWDWARRRSRRIAAPDRAEREHRTIEHLFFFFAGLTGLFGLGIYHETNVIAVRNALEARDSATRTKFFGSDGKDGGDRMALVFVELPDGAFGEKDCEARRLEIQKWAKDAAKAVVAKEHQHEVPDWKSVRELYLTLFNGTELSNNSLHDARRAYFHVVDYLYLAHDAFQARRKHIFDNHEYQMWAAYIDDLGGNPYFLMTIVDGHERGYMTKAFSDEIWDRFARTPRLRCMAKILYPELAADRGLWSAGWGKRGGTDAPSVVVAPKPSGGDTKR